MVDIRRTRHGWHVRAWMETSETDDSLLRNRLYYGDDANRIKFDSIRPIWARNVLFNEKEVMKLEA